MIKTRMEHFHEKRDDLLEAIEIFKSIVKRHTDDLGYFKGLNVTLESCKMPYKQFFIKAVKEMNILKMEGKGINLKWRVIGDIIPSMIADYMEDMMLDENIEKNGYGNVDFRVDTGNIISQLTAIETKLNMLLDNLGIKI
jgi:hypothetical protein